MSVDADKRRLQSAILEAAFDGIELFDANPLEAQVHGAACCAGALSVLIACISDAMLPGAIEHHAAQFAAGASPRKFDA